MKPFLRRRAFSLIEVLIAIMVLSIGLLGLGMVFPVVARQQRIAQDQVRGLSSVRSFEAALLNRSELFQDQPNALWEVANALSGQVTGETPQDSWMVPAVQSGVADGSDPFVLNVGLPDDGRISLFHNGNVTSLNTLSRMYPAPFSSMGDPLFVNDFALRKVDAYTCQVAIFARRIDPGIRLPPPVQGRQYTLANILTGIPNGAARFRRSPVAVDSSMRPTLTGANEQSVPSYSNLKILRFDERPNVTGGDFGGGSVNLPPGLRYQVETIVQGDAAFRTALYAAAGQPGQKFVDNMGTVHTVLRSERGTMANSPLIVYLDRPLTAEAEQKRLDGDLWFVFSPQVPSAVSVVTIGQ